MTPDEAIRRRPVLLTVSGAIPTDLDGSIENDRRPRPDYLQMAKAFDADLLDRPGALEQLGRGGAVVERVAGANVAMAIACFLRRAQYELVFTDGEQVGMPFAALCWLTRRRPRHVMIGHRLSAERRSWCTACSGCSRRVDPSSCYAV